MFKFIIGLILILMPIVVAADTGYTNLEIVNLVNERIHNYAITTISIVSIFITGLGGTLVWLFTLINDNKKIVVKIIDDNKKLALKIEESRHNNHHALMGKIEESYTHVDEKLNKHVLHVATKYIRDDKIERMVEKAVKPIQDQLTNLQNSLNEHFTHRSKQMDRISDN